jgi:hypothetical protein
MASSEVLNEVKKVLKETNQNLEISNKRTAQALLDVQENVINEFSLRLDRLEAESLIRSGGSDNDTSSPSTTDKNRSERRLSLVDHHHHQVDKVKEASSKQDTKQDDEEEDLLDPVSIGDYILFNAAELNEVGFLHGDLAQLRVGLQEADTETKREALNFSDYVFMVCPMLNYRQRNELDLLEAKHENPTKLKRKQSRSEFESLQSALNLLQNRVIQEESNNLVSMDHVKSGDYTSTVKYGDLVQLQHVKSGAFLSVLESAAPFDPECRGLTLDVKGSSSALFRFMPRFKAQTEGSIVYYSHSLRLESAQQSGYYVHISPQSPYSKIPDWRNSELPKSLQTGKIYEANLATEASAKTVFKVSKYGRFTSAMKSVLHTSAYFRLYHSQSECFVQASSDSEKDRLANTTASTLTSSLSGTEVIESLTHFGENDEKLSAVRENGDPAHIPFLKKLSDLGENPDPTDPTHQIVKSVWCFETMKRSNSDVVSWDKQVRVRHVPSGRYLAVDTSEPIKVEDGGQHECWYRTFLVDDSSREEDEINEEKLMNIFDDQGRNLGFKTIEYKSMIFTVTAADVTNSNFVPDSNVSLRLEHPYKDPKTGLNSLLYLHNSEERKSMKLNKLNNYDDDDDNNENSSKKKKGTIIVKSYKLVFSTVRSAQDIFKLMALSKNETYSINYIKSLKIFCDLYCYNIKNYYLQIKSEFMYEIVTILLKIFGLQIKGDHDFNKPSSSKGKGTKTKIDWISKANATLPAAFSAMFTGGENDYFIQRLCKDMKLLDSIFDMGRAAYQRASGAMASLHSNDAIVTKSTNLSASNPWNLQGIKLSSYDDMLLVKGVQKLIHVALQMFCSNNINTQEYFGKRKSYDNQQGKLWMQTILEQLEDPLGSAVTLSKLLSSNHNMMLRYAKPDLVNRFLLMIRNLGPQPRLINFFEAICTVDGNAVKANQEMILRLTWMNVENRKKTYLTTSNFNLFENSNDEYEIIPMNNNIIIKQNNKKGGKNSLLYDYPKVKLPSGELMDGKVNKANIAKHPPKFIGKDIYESESGFYPVFVKWFGADHWTQNQDALFWSAKSLNIPTFQIISKKTENNNDDEWCRIESLCWVLEPERLCEPITGMKWSDIQSDETLKSIVNKQIQLAEYYVGQFNLLGKQCYGRSYNCIDWMQRSFSYDMLCSICYNIHLPPKIRSAATDFVKNLYLDRYPQLAYCGKPSLPEQLWVYELSETNEISSSSPRKNSKGESSSKIRSSSFSNRKELDIKNIPLIKSIKLDDPGSLAEFAITPSHKFHNNQESIFYSFPTGFKFFLLRNLCNSYLKGFGQGTIIHSNIQENNLANKITSLISALMSFGFQSSHVKIKDLLKNLVNLLDGRSDLDTTNVGQGSGVVFNPLSNRFRQTPSSPQVTSLKATIIDILVDVSNLRANFRLGKLMQKFKDYNSDEKLQIELKKIHKLVVENKLDRYDGDVFSTLFDEFEDLFVNGDGAALDLGTLSGGQNIDVILVDCLMYDDDKLFAKALTLLDRTYGQRRKLIDAVGDVTLLQQETVPIFDNVADMTSELGYLIFLVRSSEVWGVSSRVSGPFGPDKYDAVLRTCAKINAFMLHKPLVYPKVKVNKPSKMEKELSAFHLSFHADKVSEALHASSNDQDDDEQVGFNMPYPFHQDVLRSMNLQTSLVESLNIDYNLSFKGSICSSDDKINSRNYLIDVQYLLIQSLCLFVKGNTKNQKVIFKHLKRLRYHMGRLKLPETLPPVEDFTNEHKAKLVTFPGMNTESVIIECLKNNWELCESAVPRDLLEDFGALLESEMDPSKSHKLQLFKIMCSPVQYGRTIPRNQEMVVDVLLSDNLPHLQETLELAFTIVEPNDNDDDDEETKNNSSPPSSSTPPSSSYSKLACPENILTVLNGTILEKNIKCAAKLQGKRFTIDGTIKSMDRLLSCLLKKAKKESIKADLYSEEQLRTDEENQILGSDHFAALVNTHKTYYFLFIFFLKFFPCFFVFLNKKNSYIFSHNCMFSPTSHKVAILNQSVGSFGIGSKIVSNGGNMGNSKCRH